jgi:hypothetical protein
MPAPAQGNRDNRIQDIQLQTTDATQTVVVDRLIRPATAILIQTWVAARQAGDTGRAGFIRQALVYRTGAGGNFRILVTGEVAKTINWHVRWELVRAG